MNPSLQQRVEDFLATDYDLTVTTEDEAKAAIAELKSLHSDIAGAIESDLSDLAVKFQIDVYIGDYGNGRSVQLEPDDYDGYEVGAWVPSSARC